VSLRFRRAEAAPQAAVRPASVGREVLLFVIGCAVAAGLIASGGFWAVNQVASAEAINSAEVITQLDARGIVQPLLTPALLAGNAAAIRALDSVVVGRVLGSRVVRVKIWTAAGRIVYSDEHALIGESFPLGDDESEALETGRPDAEVSDLSRAENRFERSFGSLVEVYLPVRAADGTKLLFETYQLETALQADRQRVWNGIFPALAGGIVLLFLVQIPLSWRLARRLQRSSRDRAALLQRAIDSSETERRRIAGDLHDGPVQNLTAVNITLGSAAMRLAGPEEARPSRDELVAVMEGASAESRLAIRELRTMIIEIAPPDLDRGGLAPALERLAAMAREHGLLATVDLEMPVDTLTGDAATLVYRTVQEAIRNVVKHANASCVRVHLFRSDGCISVEIADDGRGFTPENLAERQRGGHAGLSLLERRAAESGATVEVASLPGRGTSIRLQLRVA